MPAAHAEELYDALRRFRESDRFVVASIQNEGIRTSLGGYLVAAAADQIWLQEVSEVQPMGLSADVDFYGATLERFRVSAEVEAREEFKTFANIFTETGFTNAHRTELQSMVDGLYGALINRIAEGRGITPEALRAAVEQTPMTGAQARELRLIDELGRPEEAERAAIERAGGDAELVSIFTYQPHRRTTGPVIAVVQGEGEIIPGPEDMSNPFGSSVMTGDGVARALLDAAEDADVRAVVFRVSSPGGSVVASDQILGAVRAVQAAGKPVVVSMGPVAASGGYYVAAEADEIIAQPTTITGSIGVVGARFTFGPALEHYFSIQSDSIDVGSPMIQWFNPQRPFTPQERAAFASFIDRAYADFLELVANGRDLTPEQAREVARGRVWTGAQALEAGLVDRLGGFPLAVERAQALANIDANERVQLRFFPAQRTPFEEFQALVGASGETAEAAARVNAILSDPRVAEALARARAAEGTAQARGAAVEVR
jgi:protease-4